MIRELWLKAFDWTSTFFSFIKFGRWRVKKWTNLERLKIREIWFKCGDWTSRFGFGLRFEVEEYKFGWRVWKWTN